MNMKQIINNLRCIPEFLLQCAQVFIRNNSSPLAAHMRKHIYRTSCEIDTGVFITNIQNFFASEGSCLYHSTYILNTDGKFFLGKNSHLGAFCYVNACRGKVSIGDNVAVGPGTYIFSYSNHYRPGKIVTDERLTADIIIHNNIFIGANCTILPGTTIQDNVVVGAGSVVKGELDSNSIYAGVPCRKVRSGWYE